MKSYIIALLFVTALIAGCGKDEPIIPEEFLRNARTDSSSAAPSNPTSPSNPNPSTPTDPSTPDTALFTYQPLTSGSYWKYSETSTGSPAVSYIITLTGKTKSYNGKLCYEAAQEYETLGEKDTTYFYTANHKYIFGSYEETVDDIIFMEYLRDDAAVGTTWENAVSASGALAGFPGRIRSKVIEKDIKRVVLSKEYSSVIHTQLTLEYKVDDVHWQNFGTYDFYIAKNIGLIQIDSSIDAGGFLLSSSSKLTEYHIAK